MSGLPRSPEFQKLRLRLHRRLRSRRRGLKWKALLGGLWVVTIVISGVKSKVTILITLTIR